MSGTNPYITSQNVTPPQRSYKVCFLPTGTTVEVKPELLKQPKEGLLGSILDTAARHGINIDHSCGGVCACSTCHILVREGIESLNDASEDEEDMLELAPGLSPMSRLACQSVPDGSCDVTVEIPNWNRNIVSESH